MFARQSGVGNSVFMRQGVGSCIDQIENLHSSAAMIL